MEAKRFVKVLGAATALFLGLVVAAPYIPLQNTPPQFEPIINHSEIKDTTNYEYQDSIEQAAKAREYEKNADRIHLH